jgi:hypothetical protein
MMMGLKTMAATGMANAKGSGGGSSNKNNLHIRNVVK